MKETWKEEDLCRFAAMHPDGIWTTDEEALDKLLWFGADVIWGEGPVMVREGLYLVNGEPQDPAGFPAHERKRGCGRLRKGAGL